MARNNNTDPMEIEGSARETDDMFAGNEPVRLSDIKSDLGIPTQIIKAKELIGKTFAISYARPFESQYKNQDYAFYCECVDPDTGEVFGTTLGGMSVIPVLEKYFNKPNRRPLVVTLQFIAGGKNDGYYTLE